MGTLTSHSALTGVHGLPSRYDENFFYWPDMSNHKEFDLIACVTIHVDDLVLAAKPWWLQRTYKQFVQKFGKVKRQVMPFVNIGMQYSRTPEGGVKLCQSEYAKSLKLIQMPSEKTTQPDASLGSRSLTPVEVTKLRGGIGSVLFLCLTRWDILWDLVFLQTKVKDATVAELAECNKIINAAKR